MTSSGGGDARRTPILDIFCDVFEISTKVILPCLQDGDGRSDVSDVRPISIGTDVES